MEITKETTMGELLEYDMGCAAILMNAGMHCVGCPGHRMESLADGAAIHGIDVDALLEQIHTYLASKGK